MEKNIENMDFSENRKKKEECFEMETKNKNKKTVIMLAVIGIAIVCICVIGVFARKRMTVIRRSFAYRQLRQKTVRLMGNIRDLKKKKTEIKNWKH